MNERTFLSERDGLILEKLEIANTLLATILTVVVTDIGNEDATKMVYEVLSSLPGVKV